MAQLNTQLEMAGSAWPDRWLAMLHGIYGAGRNWRSVARSLTAERPGWGCVLVDLREHGESRGFDPPHTLEQATADLRRVEVPGEVRAVLGHSFGGKVALLRGQADQRIEQLWIVDSTPETAEPGGAPWAMLHALRRLPEEIEDRESLVEALGAEGFARPIGLWMSANLEPVGEGYRWGLDLDAMESLLEDFFRTDLWPVVEEPRDGLEIHFIRATGSDVLGPEQAERIRQAGRENGRVFLHDIEGGHWLNADNPDALVALIGDRLP